VESAGETDTLLDHMRLDIHVRTSSATAVQAAMAENLQVDADLRIRGTAARPGVIGRLSITRGTLVLFGSKYSVNSGTIGFYNPLRIEPILDFSLKTRAQPYPRNASGAAALRENASRHRRSPPGACSHQDVAARCNGSRHSPIGTKECRRSGSHSKFHVLNAGPA
jgi:translocation and assembly module TamB